VPEIVHVLEPHRQPEQPIRDPSLLPDAGIDESVREARRVLYFQLFKTALPFDAFLESHPRMGYVNVKSFEAEALMPANSPAIRAIHDGVMQGDAFLV